MSRSEGDGKVSYPFGKPDSERIEQALGAPILVEIPLNSKIEVLPLQRIALDESVTATCFRKLSMAIMTT